MWDFNFCQIFISHKSTTNGFYACRSLKAITLPENLERIENGEPPANIVIPRGAGAVPSVPSINEKYGVNSACIAETGLIMGIGRFAGMDIIEMEDVTGGVDTNLYNIRDTILDQVKNSDHDFFF